MEPNAIFFFLFLLIFFLITIINMFNLSGKIIRTTWPGILKALSIVVMFALLVLGLILFFGDSEGNFTAGYILLFYSAAISGLNWGINLSKKFSAENKTSAAILITIGFTLILPLALYLLITVFDNLDLLPPG